MKKFMKGAAIVGGIFLLLGAIVIGIGVVGGGFKDLKRKYETAKAMVNVVGKLSDGIETSDVQEIAGILEGMDASDLEALTELTGIPELNTMVEEFDFSQLENMDSLEDLEGLEDLGAMMESPQMQEFMNSLGDLNISFGGNDFSFSGIFGTSDFFNSAYEIYSQGTYTIDNVVASDLEVEVGEGSLNVAYHNETGIKLEVGPNDQAQCYVEGNTLKIYGKRTSLNGDSSITVYLPNTISFNQAEIEIGAGSINLTNMSIDDLDINVGMGYAYLQGKAPNNLSIDCGMGSVEANLSGTYTEYDYDLSCGMGSVSVADVYTMNGVGEYSQINNAGKMIEVDCGMGSVTVEFTE